MTGFDRDAYRERIGLSGGVTADVDGLARLHRAQAGAISFENFDILLGRPIELGPEALFDKLVRRRRGGYCFELNGLLNLALAAFGFEVRPLLARVHLQNPPSPRTHELLLVSIGGRDWIADVGFGGMGLRFPMPFELGRAEAQEGDVFRLTDAGPYGVMLEEEGPEGWRALYSFSLGPVFPADIAMGNFYTSWNPDVFFTFAKTAARTIPGGRITLIEERLRRIAGAEESFETLEPGPPYLAALEQVFGIRLDAPYEALMPLRERLGPGAGAADR
ncbi:MAG TPA: arylamine N-acetyltransferase [Paracoccaceae bacterium]|nr:arylamine N-acetyltransferase [Paracoccaceae bacterium]